MSKYATRSGKDMPNTTLTEHGLPPRGGDTGRGCLWVGLWVQAQAYLPGCKDAWYTS